MSKYPESKKWAKCEEKHRAVMEFLDWLDSEWVFICCGSDEGGNFSETFRSNYELAQTFLGIDPKKLEAERREMLRELNEDGK